MLVILLRQKIAMFLMQTRRKYEYLFDTKLANINNIEVYNRGSKMQSNSANAEIKFLLSRTKVI